MFVIKPEDFIGKQFGHYQLVEFLKGGGFGLVYKADHTKLHRTVALKLLKPELIVDADKVAAFEREASIIANLTHPRILDIYHYDVFHGIPFIVMPFIEQGSLLKLHPRGSRLNLQTIVSYATHIAEALQYAHDQKIVHRDIKPDNVLVGKHGLLLTDFGIAITAHSLQSLSLQEALGTLPYMAPEQFEGQAQIWSDQYALAVVVYEWLCGKFPFSGRSYAEFYDKHKKEAPPSFKLQGVEVLPSVEAVVMKALAKEPKDRFSDVQAFATAFDQASQQQQEPTVVRQPIIHKQPVLSPFDKPPGTTLVEYRGHISTHGGRIYSLWWSPNGEYIASVSDGGTLQVWEAATGNRKFDSGHTQFRSLESWSPNGKYITLRSGCDVQILDLDTGERKFEFQRDRSWEPNFLAWSPDDKYITLGAGTMVHIWEADTGEKKFEFPGKPGYGIHAMAWSPDGKYIVAVTCNYAPLFDSNTGEKKFEFSHSHRYNLQMVDWSPDGEYVALKGYNIVDIWELGTGEKKFEISGEKENPDIVWSPSGRCITLREKDAVQVWELSSGRKIAHYINHYPAQIGVWSPDGQYLASAKDNIVRILESDTGRSIVNYTKHSNVKYALWSPDGTKISSVSDQTVHVWVAPK